MKPVPMMAIAPESQNSSAFMARVIRSYPRQFATLSACFILAGISESLGITSILPLIGQIGGGATTNNPAQHIIDQIFTFLGLQQTIGTIIAVIVSLIVLRGIMNFFAISKVGFITAHITNDLRLRFIRSLMNAQWAYYKKLPIGKSTNTISTDAERASLGIFGFGQVVSDVFQIFFYLGFSFLVSLPVTLAACASGCVLIFALRFLIRRSRRAGEEQTRLFRQILSRLADALGDIKSVKTMGQQKYFLNVLETESFELAQARKDQILAGQIMGTARDPVIAIMMGIGLYFMLKTTSIPFSSLLVLALLYFRTVSRLSLLQSNIQQMVIFESAYWSIENEIDQANLHGETNKGSLTPVFDKGITFQDVTFSYQSKSDETSNQSPILRNFNGFIPARQFTAISGDSGTGKTTLVDLLSGLYTPASGVIKIDDIDLHDIDLGQWRSAIGYVSQDHNLLHESLFLNISMGKPEITREDAMLALKKAGADFVFSLPDGLDTNAGEKGARFSGGQKQRIVMARAIVSFPRLLILDEPTSALDKNTELELIKTLKDIAKETTVLCITHSDAMTRSADNIIKL